MKCFTNGSEQSKANRAKRAAFQLFAVLCSLFALRCSSLLACPFCSSNTTTGMAKGFYWSILLMLAVPVVVVGTIAGVIWRAGRQKKGDLPGAHPE
jgi:hypothetical protein